MTREQEVAMERCADFLARMILKYGTQFLDDLKKKKSQVTDEAISACDKDNQDRRK